MKSQPVETLVPDVVRVSAGHIYQFISSQTYSQSEDLHFFSTQLAQIHRGSINPNFVTRFTTVLSHLSQAPLVTQNQLLNQHFRVLKRHLSSAINTTVHIGQGSRQDLRSYSTADPMTSSVAPHANSHSSIQAEDSELMLGKYRVLEKVGEGGNGVVYLGINPISQQRVALKCLLNLQSQELIEAVRDEARVAARINHPNCVKVRDMVVDESRGSPVIVSDFIDGLNGRDFLGHSVLHKFEDHVLPPRAALLMFEQMVKGVRAAHKTGIVHRDIKPENFLVTKETIHALTALPNNTDLSESVVQTIEKLRDEAWVLLSDWGLALEKKGLSLTTSKTFNLGTIPLSKQGGTLVYMPLEQIEGSNIGRKSDVFALGLVLYELLTGASALEARSFAEGVSNDPNMTAQAFLVAVASARARCSIDPSKDPHLKRLLGHKELMKLLQAMTARDRNDRLSSSGLEAAIQDLLAGKKPKLGATRTGRLSKQMERGGSEEAEGSQAILFLQGLAIGLVVLLVTVLGYAMFSKSKDRPVN
ncbi:MAG: serine/threonine-protein kinase, partial [Planctomycetota bacterium]|nr:serine/threonine-protein kinase [Planctomycetota bacterium]